MKLKETITKLGKKKFSPMIGIAANAAVAGSCAISIAAQPLSWATVVQAALIGWTVGAILMLLLIERSMKQNRLTQQILEEHGKAVDRWMELELENFAMRQYFKVNNIEFTVTRDGTNINATAEYKGPDAGDATDHHAGKDRTVH